MLLDTKFFAANKLQYVFTTITLWKVPRQIQLQVEQFLQWV